MGVDYRVWLLPKDRTLKPTAEQIAALANALRDEGWVPQPNARGHESAMRELLPGGELMGNKPFRSEPLPPMFEPSWISVRADNELVLEWWVNDATEAGVRFPFNFVPFPEHPATYFGIRVIVGPEYFYWTGENVMPFADSETQCRCGEQLAYWTGYASGVPGQRILPQCPSCGLLFDVSGAFGEIIHPWTGEPRKVAGGMAFHFALQIDCHKNFPATQEEFDRFHLQDEICRLWQSHIRTPYEMIDTAD